MRESIESLNFSPEDARARLIQLGVAEHFLRSEDLDYTVLYERLRFF